MELKSLTDVSQACVVLLQEGLFPMMGICFALALVFFVIQIAFSIQDYTLQFLLRVLFVGAFIVLVARSYSEKFVDFTRGVFESAPNLLR